MRAATPAALIFFAACSSPMLAPSGAPARPNVVLIIADDLGWTDLSTGRTNHGNGSDYYRTPRIDALVASGVAFTDAYSCPNCVPSRAAIWTGLAAPRTSVYTVPPSDRGLAQYRALDGAPTSPVIESAATTIAEAIAPVGYSSGYFGKWHLGSDPSFGPTANGWGVNRGGTGAGAITGGSDGHFARGDGSFAGVFAPNGKPAQFAADRVTDETVSWIDSQAGPFFAVASHFSPHVPIQAPASYVAAFDGVPKGVRHRDQVYAAMLANLDENVGRLLDHLDSTPDPRWTGHALAENTVVVFVSDNGGVGGYVDAGVSGAEEITHNYPLRSGKGSIYEGGIRVPMAVRWTGTVMSAIESTPVFVTDLLPTIAELAGAQIGSTDGISLVPLLAGGFVSERSLFWHFPCYLEADAAAGTWRSTPCSAIRRGDWKLVFWYETRTVQLFDLAVDIGENVNVASTHFSLASSMISELRDWLVATGAALPRAKGTTIEVPLPSMATTTETPKGAK